jgi:hypothetical protein
MVNFTMGDRNAMLDGRMQGNAMMWDVPQQQRHWYGQPGSPWPIVLSAADKAAGVLAQPVIGAYNGWREAMGYSQDPNAAPGYVTTDSIRKTGMDMAEGAVMGSAFTRAPAAALRSGAAGKAHPEGIKVNREGHEYRESPLDVKSPHGQILGNIHKDGDLSIGSSRLYNPQDKGKGRGSELYRAWAEEAGAPFRSDYSVSPNAQVMYENMFPKHGYNVMRNPRAVRDSQGKMHVPSDVPFSNPMGHIYRVEPPGQHTDRTFYANNKNAAGAAALDRREQESPNMMFQRGLY